MQTTVTQHDFVQAFANFGRANSFSREGFKALYEWIEEYDLAAGRDPELDVVAIDCDFMEYSSIEEFHENYSKKDYPDMESISDNTTVIPVGDGGFIIQSF